MNTLTGLDKLSDNDFSQLKGQNIGILCHQASINHKLKHIIELLLPLHKTEKICIKALYGPQHGIWGHTQDNMIEWSGYEDSRLGLKIFSLYGKHREPTANMLADIDTMVIDLQDIGARYYTFIWTMALMMKACEEQGIRVMILDRPNPISGTQVEGTVLQSEYRSFVGLYPLPQRHGMTIGEIAHYLKGEYFSSLNLQIIQIEGWKRNDYFPDTGLPWTMPSPNIPFWETALVYPGTCLLEATNLSEGRGTTRPFEIFGASWIDGWQLCRRLNDLGLPSVYFRPIQFQPTFQKFRGEVCEGGFIHVLDRIRFRPVLTAMAILSEIKKAYPEEFRWKDPPYEYEYEKLPINILSGTNQIKKMIDSNSPLNEFEKLMQEDCSHFESIRAKYLLY